MSYLEQIQVAVEYIEDNLDEKLSSTEISSQAGMSQWHFQRIFKALTNETLKAYIRSRRLSKALQKLIQTDERIIVIAMEAGFETQESFTRAFKKAFQMTPLDARKQDARNFLYKKPEFNLGYLRHINENISLEPEIVSRPQRMFVGLNTTFYSVDSEKNNIAEKLPSLWERFVPRMAEVENARSGFAFGIIQQTEEKTDLLQYLAACEVSEASFIPEGMQAMEIPSSRYARFIHHGKTDSIDDTVNYVYSNWLLKSEFQHSFGADIEEYGPEFRYDSEESIMYYHIPLAQELND